MASSNALARLPPRISAYGAKFATIVATGTDGDRSFIVHEELLKYHSSFFRAALDGNFKEAETRELCVEAPPHTVEFFVHWLYYQRLPIEQDHPDLFKLWQHLRGETTNVLDYNFLRFHVFCDKYDVPAPKRLTLDLYMKRTVDGEDLPDRFRVRMTFDELPHNAPWCRFLVDIYCERAKPESWELISAVPEWEPPAIFYKLALKRYSGFSFPERTAWNACDYHDHKDEEERNACAAKSTV
ncbi:hypothetical protein E8E12_004188 [Didymella heteroderae]|uniref:BTB domain-containing protein n=1 Tax=Didymella heteroderae TaxID=1769908 RepID=A0A9P4WQP3_9PLEO|nr:hypothetical protein E8E12_004188 [Didymella heteroderae]